VHAGAKDLLLGFKGNKSLMRFLLHVLTVAIALFVTTSIVPGVRIESTTTLIVAAIVLGIVNAIVRPVLFILTLPFTLLTLGLFYLIVNGVAFALAASLVRGFSVSSWSAAIVGAFVTSLVSWLVGALTQPSR
jgi:putative membrane protein